jgi:hypothetical protein
MGPELSRWDDLNDSEVLAARIACHFQTNERIV